MTPKWFKITADLVIRESGFFFNIKPDTFGSHRKQNSTDDQTKGPATFSWHLIFYVKRYSFLVG